MKIMYTIEDFSVKGGAENIIAQKANYLATACGHDVTIVSIYRDNRPPSYPLAADVKLVSLDIPFVERQGGIIKKTIHRMQTMVSILRKFQKTVDETRPDIIFFTLSLGALMLPFCRTRAKKVYESHLARLFTPYKRMFWMMERRADIVVCLTEGDAHEYGNARRVVVIPNFIEQPRVYANDYSAKRAIAVGRLESQKGFDILINCWATIATLHPDWHLDIYGEGSKREELQAQIDHLHLNEHITLCGRSNNIMDVYPQYSLHIMTSRYEGLPMTLIEAQACGLPSVVTNFKFGSSDIVTSGSNGIIVPQGDKKAIANALCTMMNSEALRTEYGRNALRVGRRFYKENVFAQWTELIESLKKA